MRTHAGFAGARRKAESGYAWTAGGGSARRRRPSYLAKTLKPRIHPPRAVHPHAYSRGRRWRRGGWHARSARRGPTRSAGAPPSPSDLG
eukprot:9467192-Pyramimonas_sp.AAC.1